ncbi:MAG: hypothetical protein ACHQNA_13350 [Acidimicrobiales bacterium]
MPTIRGLPADHDLDLDQELVMHIVGRPRESPGVVPTTTSPGVIM